MKPLRWIVYLALLIALPTVSVLPTANAQSSYQFHAVTAQEYSAAFPRIVNAAFDIPHFRDEVDRGDILAMGQREFDLRYWETESFAVAADFYALLAGYGFTAPFQYIPYLDPVDMYVRLVERWLTENPTDFAMVDRLTFAPFTITVTPTDYNDDGEMDWLLYIEEGGFAHFWTALGDEQAPGGYRIDPLPIPYRSSVSGSSEERRSGAELVEIADRNGNGLPELVFSTFAPVPANWSIAVWRFLYVLEWHDDAVTIITQTAHPGDEVAALRPERLASLAQDPFHVENVDADAAYEWVLREASSDNWQCDHTKTTIYDWDGTYYVPQPPVEVWAETLNCALRWAEEAMSQNEFDDAIPNYQLALVRYAAMSAPTPLDDQFAAYAQERLAVAYIQSDQLDAALEVIADLAAHHPPPDTIAAGLITAAAAADVTPYNLCLAAHDQIEALPGGWARGDSYRGLPGIGFTDDQFDAIVGAWGGSGDSAGCNTLVARQRIIETIRFPVSTPPLNTLQNLGVRTDGAESFSLDFNGDDVTDWLVAFYPGSGDWTFGSDGEYYQLSWQSQGLMTSYYYDDQTRVPFVLPDGHEQAVLVTEPLIPNKVQTPAEACFFEDGSQQPFDQVWMGQANLWRWGEEQWTLTNTFYLCAPEPISLDTLPNGDIQAWRIEPRLWMSNAVFLPTRYLWDSASRTYTQEPEVTTPPEASQEQQTALWTAHSGLLTALFTDHDFAAAIDLADQLRALDSTYRPEQIAYLRALALEMSGRTDDALAEYVTLYEADPYSAWGLLAALHFTRGES